MTRQQEQMKTDNKIVRSKSMPVEEKVKKLVENGHKEDYARKMIAEKIEWPSYALTNNNTKINAAKKQLEKANVRVVLDDSDASPGWKFNEWELKGVPLRIELGPRDIEAGKALIFRRDTLTKEEYALDAIADAVKTLLNTVQKDMLEAARSRRDKHIVEADSLKGILDGVEGGNFVKASWCGCRECEDKIKSETAATARVIADGIAKKCAVCGKKAQTNVYFARAY